MSELSNPHDKFFKETFSRPEAARSLLYQSLPQEVVVLLDLDTLELRKDSFIDKELQEQFSDLLYLVQLQDGRPAYVYFLLEHKSYYDPLISFQLLRYMVRIWERELRQGAKSLRPIVPLVIYHGRDPWPEGAASFRALFAGPAELQNYWPAFAFELYDLSIMSPSEIRGAVLAQIGLLLLKYIFDDRLRERLPDIFALFRELADKETALGYLETALRYLSAAAEEIAPDDLREAVETTFEGRGGEAMSTLAQQWIEQGIKQGIRQGIKQGVQKGRQEGLQKGRQEGLQEGRQEGLQEGRQEGRQQAIRENILELLELRLGTAPAAIAGQLEIIESTETLRQLLRRAVMVNNLAEFEQALQEAA